LEDDMEGASLPVLAAAQTLTTMGAAAVAPAAATAIRDSFAAILGATDLTGLTADQQAALTQLLADPAGTLPRAADAVGKELPQAAIRGLLAALGGALDAPILGSAAAMTTTAAPVELPSGNEADPGADLAALLAMLLPAVVTPDAQAPRVEPSPAGSGAADGSNGLLLEVALPLVALLPGTGAGAAPAQAPGDEQRPAAIDALWAMIRHAGRSLGAAGAAGPQSGASPDAATPEAASSDFDIPANFLAAVASVAKDAGTDMPLISDLTRGLATALTAAGPGEGQSGLAVAPDLVPPRVAAVVSEAVSVPVGERGWERAFGERVVWLVGQQIQSAEVRLNPPHLGPVEVRLSLTGQDANVSFTVAHGATRDAIEQAIPRLRELFAEHQLQIVNVDVGQRDASSQASQGDRRGQGSSPSAGVGASTSATGAESVASVQRGGLPGLVDEYV
jgi:hypothetical protein